MRTVNAFSRPKCTGEPAHCHMLQIAERFPPAPALDSMSVFRIASLTTISRLHGRTDL